MSLPGLERRTQPGIRISGAAALLFFPLVCLAQPKAEIIRPAQLDVAQAQRQGQLLVSDLLSQRPTVNSTNTGVVTIRAPDGQSQRVPVKFEILTTSTNWLALYEVTGSNSTSSARLIVIHTDARPNQYLLCRRLAPGSTNEICRQLTGNQAAVPFAGSDFWITDLGLEFLHWPQQLLLKKELRKGQSCNVLESTNPDPAPGAYSRVVSWIGIETGGIIHADAYDDRNALLKQFDPKTLTKIQGEYQLSEMEIRNRQTGSRTRIEFNYEH
jgi:hypothetical protein